MTCIPCDFLTNYFMINYFINLFEAAVNTRYRWIWFIKKRASNDSYVCTILWLLFLVSFNLCFCFISQYLFLLQQHWKAIQRKTANTAWYVRLYYWSTESLTMFLDHIIHRFDVVLESRSVREGCNTITSPSTTVIPIFPFGTPMNKYSTATKFCKIKIFEKYALGRFIFGRFTTAAWNFKK